MKIYCSGRDAIYQGVVLGDGRSGTTRNIGLEARKRIDKKLGIKRDILKIFSKLYG